MRYPLFLHKPLHIIPYTTELLGIHLNSVDRYIKQGAIPARKLGSRWLIPASALRAWLEGKDEQNPAMQGGAE
ncbi:helix-turn-helix domain-containing protein [Meiothermus sp.]|uniref:helix-turn-helix domain-containing protein n=1 Tax=Meiothermus sp. TaxID=1955249 RepID=UPI0035B5227D